MTGLRTLLYKDINSRNPQISMANEHIDSSSEARASAPETDNIGDKLRREAELFGSLGSTFGAGFMERKDEAVQNWQMTAFEAGSGVALGAAFALMNRNPAPLARAITKWGGRAFLTAAGLEIGSKFADPAVDVWSNPDHLDHAKERLGQNVGGVVFDTALAIGTGSLGAALGPRVLERTGAGAFLQGYKIESDNGLITQHYPDGSRRTISSPFFDAKDAEDMRQPWANFRANEKNSSFGFASGANRFMSQDGSRIKLGVDPANVKVDKQTGDVTFEHLHGWTTTRLADGRIIEHDPAGGRWMHSSDGNPIETPERQLAHRDLWGKWDDGRRFFVQTNGKYRVTKQPDGYSSLFEYYDGSQIAFGREGTWAYTQPGLTMDRLPNGTLRMSVEETPDHMARVHPGSTVPVQSDHIIKPDGTAIDYVGADNKVASKYKTADGETVNTANDLVVLGERHHASLAAAAAEDLMDAAKERTGDIGSGALEHRGLVNIPGPALEEQPVQPDQEQSKEQQS